MPSYTCTKKDLEHLIGEGVLSLDRIEEMLEYAKSELKGHDEPSDELKLENNDTNRPDLWSAEGTARQIRSCCFSKNHHYDFFEKEPAVDNVIMVDDSVKDVRPFIGGFRATGITVDDALLAGLIQTQEKLCENYGRSRDLIAIGVYDASQITLPIRYRAVEPGSVRFAPLDFTEEMTLDEICARHPKGIQYGGIVKSSPRYPIITDSRDKVLSFPPVINSNDLGCVVPGNTHLFVEVTGKEKDAVTLAVNIMACNLADRGAVIHPFMVRYPGGDAQKTPWRFDRRLTISQGYLLSITGEEIDIENVIEHLGRMDYTMTSIDRDRGCSEWALPPFRLDALHPVDLAEDYCIARGYSSFTPEMPDKFTIGLPAPIMTVTDRARELMVGLGFQEVMTYILTNRETLCEKMNDPVEPLEISNIMSESYSAIRSSLVPILLEIESKNSDTEYPHRIFETGEIARKEPSSPDRTATDYYMAALIAHSTANFSELSSFLQAFMYYAGLTYRLEQREHPSFIPGRVGMIMVDGRECGIIGEVHPAVLENWAITVPCAAFEFDMKKVFAL